MTKLFIVDGKKKANEEAKRYYFKAHEALKSGKWIKAINYLEKSLSIKPDYQLAFRDIADIYHHYGDIQKAQNYIQKALEINDKDPVALFIQGVIYISMGDIRMALKNFEKSKKHGELTWGLAYNLGLCHYVLGKTEKSIQLLNYAIKQDPSQPQTYLLLAQIFINQNKQNMANEILKKVKKIRPTDKQLDSMITELLDQKKE